MRTQSLAAFAALLLPFAVSANCVPGQVFEYTWTSDLDPGLADAGMPAEAIEVVPVPEGCTYSEVSVDLSWDLPVNDFDMEVTDPNGGKKTSGNAPVIAEGEHVSFHPGVSGEYEVKIIGFLNAPGSVNGRLQATYASNGGALVYKDGDAGFAGARMRVHAAPAGIAEGAGEPTLDVTYMDGDAKTKPAVMFIAGLEVDRVTFNEANGDDTWEKTSGQFLSNITTLDPILTGDRDTGRIWAMQLIAADGKSVMDYTDDGGQTWFPGMAGGFHGGADHQGMGSGPYPPDFPIGGLLYTNAVYYCSQDIYAAYCSRSDDGGVTFGTGVPVYSLLECGGLHGHPKVGPQGTVYLPNKGCSSLSGGGSGVAVVVSEDAGLTWTVKVIPGTGSARWDPSVAIGADGAVYVGYMEEDIAGGSEVPRVVVSHDKGNTWSAPVDVGAPYGIQNAVFPAIVAGDANKAGFFFLGTTTPGDSNNNSAAHMGSTVEDAAEWYGYVATTYDGGASWHVTNATPGDPVQRGDICSGGTSCATTGLHRNLLDFNDAVIGYDGRMLAGFADGCVGSCATGDTISWSDKGTILRQVDGPCLIGEGSCAVDNNGGGPGPGDDAGDVCVAPGYRVLADGSGDSSQGPVAPSTDLREIRALQLDDGDGSYSMVLSVVVEDASTLSPYTEWPLEFNVKGVAPIIIEDPVNGDTEVAHFEAVASTDVTGSLSFKLINNQTDTESSLPGSSVNTELNAFQFVIPSELLGLGVLGDAALEKFLIRVSTSLVAIRLTPDNMPDSLSRAGLVQTKASCDVTPPPPSGEVDTDNDGYFDSVDNCPTIANNQDDTDADGVGDACDLVLTLNADPAQSDVESGPVTLTASVTNSGQGDLRYYFYFGDGQNSLDQASASASHDYAQAGNYTAHVVVVEDGVNSASASVDIKRTTSVQVQDDQGPQPVRAALSLSANGGDFRAPATLTLDASGSDAPVGSSYCFDFGDGFSSSNCDQKIVQHQYNDPGTYVATVTVTSSLDNTVTDTAQAVITVAEGQETVAQLTVSPRKVKVNQAVTFDASASTAASGLSITDYHFDFGDGNSLSGTRAVVTHTYNTAGTWEPSLTVTDSADGSATTKAFLFVTVTEDGDPQVTPTPVPPVSTPTPTPVVTAPTPSPEPVIAPSRSSRSGSGTMGLGFLFAACALAFARRRRAC